MDDPRQQLRFALDKYPDQVEMAPVQDLMTDAARQNVQAAATRERLQCGRPVTIPRLPQQRRRFLQCRGKAYVIAPPGGQVQQCRDRSDKRFGCGDTDPGAGPERQDLVC